MHLELNGWEIAQQLSYWIMFVCLFILNSLSQPKNKGPVPALQTESDIVQLEHVLYYVQEFQGHQVGFEKWEISQEMWA